MLNIYVMYEYVCNLMFTVISVNLSSKNIVFYLSSVFKKHSTVPVRRSAIRCHHCTELAHRRTVFSVV